MSSSGNENGELALVTGPLLLGYLIGYLFYGMSSVQFFLYHTHYPNDNRYIKATVWGTYTIETILTALTGVSAWRTFGSGWGKLESIEIIDVSWIPLPILNSLPALIVQLFFAWRIWKLTGKPWISGLIALLGCAMAWYYNIRIDMLGRKVSALLVVWLACNTFCDVLITSVILFILVRVRSESSIPRTNATLLSIIKFTVETGLVTAIWSIFELTLFLSMPHNSFHWIFFLSRGRLYNNWLLATLNSRRYVSQSSAASSAFISVNWAQQGMWSDHPSSTTAADGTSSSRMPRVQISTATEVRVDHEMDLFRSTKDDESSRSKV
ncbi:hypothetical protein ONZ45_g8703 [Pleurotus djamor]|nr:hypothetical protein ONZ45_g8703 [Pleurotus djamor]